ncbi:MAG TPA: multicopper oxidase domain-containing protein [Kiloniellaceae bacterium]|nr:multicopper oxidase domain-containing protein [Kiloniellaceae bacterium]
MPYPETLPGPKAAPLAVDVNPDPKIFETTIVAQPAVLDLTGSGKLVKVESYNGSVPGPEIRVKVGDRVIVHFENHLNEPSSIHWHGIELNNASDGTAVTQDPVMPGGSYLYDYIVTRPGVFWYHPHIKPTNQVFKGLYAALVVTAEADEALTEFGVLPERRRTLVLSDITVCKAIGKNDPETYPANPDLPWSGGPAFPGHSGFPTPQDLCETPIDSEGQPIGKPLRARAVPNIQPAWDCGARTGACRTNEGQIVLTNGQQPAGRKGSPAEPGKLDTDAAPLAMMVGEGLRLQVVNAATSRYFRLRLTDQSGTDLPLYRVGGEGGLLNRVRLEGGLQQGLETKFGFGEIVLAPSDRSDFVLVVPTARAGDVLTLWSEDYSRTGRGFANLPSVPVLHIRVTGRLARVERFKIRRGQALLVDPRVDQRTETLRGLPKQKLLNPAKLAAPRPGSGKWVMRFTQSPGPSIDNVRGAFDGGNPGGFMALPHIASSRFARVGDLLSLKVTNSTFAHHPFHLHGFSFQPIRMMQGEETLYRYRYREFVDTVDIHPGHSLVYRVRLDDRTLADGTSLGGAIGRWVFHCHIFSHAGLGKISELVVLPKDSDELTWDPAVLQNGICRAPRQPDDWKLAGTSDYDDSGAADVLWRKNASSADKVWRVKDFTRDDHSYSQAR